MVHVVKRHTALVLWNSFVLEIVLVSTRTWIFSLARTNPNFCSIFSSKCPTSPRKARHFGHQLSLIAKEKVKRAVGRLAADCLIIVLSPDFVHVAVGVKHLGPARGSRLETTVCFIMDNISRHFVTVWLLQKKEKFFGETSLWPSEMCSLDEWALPC